MEDALDAFLRLQQGEGERESDGVFTVDPARAFEKMAAQSQPFSEAWVLRLVQAAVRGAQGLQVVQTARDTTFTYQQAEDWTWARLSPILFSPAAGGSSPLHYLADALRWLVYSVERAFTLQLMDGTLIRWDHDGMALQLRPLLEGATPWLTVEHASAQEKASLLSRLVRPGVALASAIAEVLQRRCYTCPVPLLLDGRLLTGLHNERRFVQSPGAYLLAVLRVPESESLPRLDLPDWEESSRTEGFAVQLPHPVGGSSTAEPRLGPVGALALLAAFATEERASRGLLGKASRQRRYYPSARPSYLLWVCDGVVMAEEPLGQLEVGVMVLVSAEGLRRDLSGFALVQDESYAARRQAALQAIEGELDRIARQQSVDVSPQGDGYYAMGLLRGLVGAVLLLPVGLLMLWDAYKVRKEDIFLETESEKVYSRALGELRDGLLSHA
jgi:hypothetical protein